MVAALSAIPSIVSGTVFSSRRANRGIEAQNPVVGAMNFNIAAGQIYKAAECTSNLAKDAKTALASKFISAEKAIKSLSQGDKVLEGVGKVVQYTADHVNPIICATGAVKVAFSDDKVDAGIKEGAALTTMFAFEKAAKKFLGMPQVKRINGKSVVIPQTALYEKNPMLKNFFDKQMQVISDYCVTKDFMTKAVKYVPGILKGLCFVGASITGYMLGSKIGKKISAWVKGDKAEKCLEQSGNINEKSYAQAA